MKKIYYIFFLLISCNKAPLDFMVKEGEALTETRILGNFDSIIINDLFDIMLVPDSICFVEITSGKNILPYVKTSVQNTTLNLENNIKGRWSRPYHHPQLSLHFKEIKYIVLNESSNLSSTDSINCNPLQLFVLSELAKVELCFKGTYLNFASSHSSTGSHQFRGKLDNAKLFPGGTSLLNAYELTVGSAVIFQNSIADMKVNITQNISELRIFRNGKVHVKGNPPQRNLEHVMDPSLVIFE